MKHPVNKIFLVNSYYSTYVVGGTEVVTQILAQTFTWLGIKRNPRMFDFLILMNPFVRDKYFLQELSESAYKHTQFFLPEHIAKRYFNVFQRVLGTDIAC